MSKRGDPAVVQSVQQLFFSQAEVLKQKFYVMMKENFDAEI